MIRPKVAATVAPTNMTTRKGGFQPIVADAAFDIMAATYAPEPRKAIYPRSSKPARPTTILRPIAVAAKMITCVAIDILASDPSWVNGKRKATTKAAKVKTLRLRWAT